MRYFEINGNLSDESELNYTIFSDVISLVRNYYIDQFGENLMNSIELYVDNATEGSGPFPIITPIFKKYLIMKLGIRKNDRGTEIVYQSSHEFMHYVYFAIKGICKGRADAEEESICSAASIILVKEFYPIDFSLYYEHLKNHKNHAYRKGITVAESVDFSFQKLKELVYTKTGYQG